MQNSDPIIKDLVLVGGGHSHAIVLKLFGMQPIPGVRLTLIADVSHTPYSGMLPGHVAGLYEFDECHIDLRRLAQFAKAQFLLDQAIALDLENNRVVCAGHAAVGFDLVSIDIGSTPAALSVPGAKEYAISAKPISKFLAQWNQLVEKVTQAPEQPLCLGIVGGGAGGVELALAIQAHLHQIYRSADQPITNLKMHLFQRGRELLPHRNPWVSRRFEQIFRDRQIHLHLNENVVAVEAPDPQRWVKCESGLTVACDRIFWVTQASVAPWLQESGLATSQGFIQVNDTLQSVSHPQVFAAGDVATMIHHPRPKAGVFAVRQSKPLFQNLRRALQGQPLRPFVPQKQFLSLIGTGDRSAVASRGYFGCGPSPLFWQWKEQIDRKFMNRFNDLPAMSDSTPGTPHPSPLAPHPSSNHQPVSKMRCAGCGSKVGSTALERVLQRIKTEQPVWSDREDILIGLDAPDDAAVVQVPAGQVMVQTIDYFPALINDPFIFGQISTNHCLSDIFAMGAMPQSALAIATIPYALEAKVEETLYQLLSGAVKMLSQSQTPLIGGHTSEGAELAFGLSSNGLAHPDRLLRKGGMQPGQVLILTKGIGTGTLFAANMRLQAKGRWIDAAVQSMLLSNQAAAECFLQHQATACTDITGFGLLGHLMEMIRASQIAVELDLEAIPSLDGAQETVEQGIVSSLQSQNLKASHNIRNLFEVSDRPLYPLLFDPQTSGGLLAAIPAEQADFCLSALKQRGYGHSSVIGRAIAPVVGVQPIMIR